MNDAQPTAPGEARGAVTSRSARRVLIAASLGTLIEWYDFALFVVGAGLVINPVFFPDQTGIVGLLAVMATFAVGYVIRPVGGVVLSNLGDRWGRKPTLVLTIVLMSVGTVGIGLLPTPAQIGVLAPILLVFLRLVQGFGAGAELTGAITLVAEYYPGRRLGLATGITFGMSGAGGVLATLAFLAVVNLPGDAFLEWGWRLPFLASGVLFVVALWLRRALDESPEYSAAIRAAEERDGRVRRLPILMALSRQPGMVVRGFFIWCAHNAFGYLALTFGVNYLATVAEMSATETLTISVIGFSSFVVWSLLWAWLSDVIGHRRLLVVFGVAVIVSVTPYLLLVGTGEFWPAFLAIVGIGGCVAGISQGVIGAVTTAMFPAEYRYSALTLGKELNAAVIGGPTPLIATALLAAGGGAPWFVVGFIVLMAVCTLAAIAKPPALATDASRAPSGSVQSSSD